MSQVAAVFQGFFGSLNPEVVDIDFRYAVVDPLIICSAAFLTKLKMTKLLRINAQKRRKLILSFA